SVNLTGDLGNGNLLRFGLGKQLARADLTDQRNSFAGAVDTNPQNRATFGRFVGSGGNPFLKPYRATALDLSFEKYLGTKAYFAAAVFYKDLDTYITKFTDTNYNFSSYASQIGLSIPPAGPIGTFTQAVNGKGGTLRGFELSASTPLIPSCGYATTPGARKVAMFVGGPSGRALTSALPAKSVTGSNRSFTVPSWMVTMYVLPG
ncbi:MAG: TonB-dependent receptor, partial [Chloroflexi bacterium]|nr:TonB-dependent receptor [Chloroflexota bacterium]